MLRFARSALSLAVFCMPAMALTLEHGASRIFYLIVACGLVAGWPGWRRLEADEKALMWSWMLYTLVGAASWWNTDDVDGYVRRLGTYAMSTLAIPGYLLFRRSDLLRRQAYRALSAGFLPAGPVMLAVALDDRFRLGLERATGAYHFNPFGLFAVLVAAILLARAFTSGRPALLRSAEALSALTALGASVLSETRGAWLCLPAVAVVLLALRWKELGRRSRGLVAGGVLLGGLLAAVATPDTVQRRLGEIFRDLRWFHDKPEIVTPVGERLHMWRDAMTMFGEDPLLGSGIGDFWDESERLIDAGRSGMTQVYPHAHNAWIHALATNGVLGMLTTLMTWTVLPAWLFMRRREQTGLIVVICYAVFGLTNIWLTSPLMTFFFLVHMVCLPRSGEEPSFSSWELQAPSSSS